MSDVAIRVENLGKRYRIGERQRYYSLRESIGRKLAGPFRSMGRRFASSDVEYANEEAPEATIWALKDVSLEIRRGEAVGIIGRNGAGKSTLLKLLSRITEPTTGLIDLCGRVGSLLEVGTGFHPELTGRENVFLNGAILGMTRSETQRKFDQIVSFAEIEKFIDTPVKHYSSGMYMRLAFSVAAHLEPEILLIDEVLAVGDATFQRRCIELMMKIARAGRTILFISHNMDLVPRLCRTAYLLDRGKVAAGGPATDIVQTYLEGSSSPADPSCLENCHRTGDGRARFLRWWLEGPDEKPLVLHPAGDDLTICLEIESTTRIPDVALAIVLKTLSGARVITSWTREIDFRLALEPGRQTYRCHFRKVGIRPGQRLGVMLWMEACGILDCIEDAGFLETTDGPLGQHWSTNPSQGAVVYDYSWERVGESVQTCAS